MTDESLYNIDAITPIEEEKPIEKPEFKPRRPDYKGTLEVVGWLSTVVDKDGKAYKVIDVKLGNRARLFRQDIFGD